MKHKILIADKLGQEGLDRLATMNDVEFDVKTGLSKDELIQIIGDYDGLIVRSATSPDEDIIKAGVKLKVIGRAGIGVDNIDLKAATRQGIVVMNTPQANSIATAENAMTMMLAVSRHVAQAHESLRQGQWEKSKFAGQQLYRKTLGLIGFGNIARIVAKRAQGFEMNVVAYDPFVSEEIAKQAKVQLLSLDELLACSDYISLHTVLTPDTKEMINAENIAKMKDGVIIINSARGKLIHEQDLAVALKSGKVKAAGVDVYHVEPMTSENPLRGLENILHLPHIGATTVEAQRDVAVQMVDQVVDLLRGDDFKNSVNLPFPVGPNFNEIRPYIDLAERIGKLHHLMSEKPISKLEISCCGDETKKLEAPITCGLLKGVLENIHNDPVNFISAPSLAEFYGLTTSVGNAPRNQNYQELITITAHMGDETRVISGTLFNKEPRIVQISDYQLEVNPAGVLLIMLNHDKPGVIGSVGTILANNNINIAEWRLGRSKTTQQALAFINLDNEPSQAVIDELNQNENIIKSIVVRFDD